MVVSIVKISCFDRETARGVYCRMYVGNERVRQLLWKCGLIRIIWVCFSVWEMYQIDVKYFWENEQGFRCKNSCIFEKEGWRECCFIIAKFWRLMWKCWKNMGQCMLEIIRKGMKRNTHVENYFQSFLHGRFIPEVTM